MFTVAVGKTLSGKDINVNPYANSESEVALCFHGYNELDLFDSLLALEYLILAEKRCPYPSAEWLKTLDHHHLFLQATLEQSLIEEFKVALDISNAFKARDYGRERTHPAFRKL